MTLGRSRDELIYISLESSSRFSSSPDVPYNTACTNATIKTDRLGLPPIPFPLIPSTRDYHLMMAMLHYAHKRGDWPFSSVLS